MAAITRRKRRLTFSLSVTRKLLSSLLPRKTSLFPILLNHRSRSLLLVSTNSASNLPAKVRLGKSGSVMIGKRAVRRACRATKCEKRRSTVMDSSSSSDAEEVERDEGHEKSVVSW